MIGPTGVGKTEIARRLARLAQAPFIKVEASKFTEVGYVGRDVESMVRDLMELAAGLVKQEEKERIQVKAQARPKNSCSTCCFRQPRPPPIAARRERPAPGTAPGKKCAGCSTTGSWTSARWNLKSPVPPPPLSKSWLPRA